MDRRAAYSRGGENEAPFFPVEGVDKAALAAASIVAAGDVCGCVISLCSEGRTKATEADSKLAAAAASFLGKQMEE